MAYLDKVPTELNRDVYTYIEIDGHSIAEAMDHFGLAKRTIYMHLNKYRDLVPLPDDYVAKLRDRAKRIGDKALNVIEDNLSSDKPDMHTAIQTAKGTGAFVEKQEIETSLVVHSDISPEEQFRRIREEWAKRNPDFGLESGKLDITHQQIASIETPKSDS